MKRCLAIAVTVLMLFTICAYAEQNEFADISDDELLLIYKRIKAEVNARGLEPDETMVLKEGRYIIGSDIEAGEYRITCLGTEADDLSDAFGALGSLYDGLDSRGNTSYSGLFSSLGSLYSSVDEGMTIEIVGDYGEVKKTINLKKGESATLTLQGKVALKISGGTCELQKK